MWASVQREFAEETKCFGVALKEILQVEAGLDALHKHLKEIGEKKEKINKFSMDGIRKKMDVTRSSSIDIEIKKLEEEENDIKLELEAKTLKAEIFKNTSVRSSLINVMDAHLKFAEKTKLIFTTGKNIIEGMPQVPSYLQDDNNIDYKDSQEPTSEEQLAELAKKLNIESRVLTHDHPSNFKFTIPSSPPKKEKKLFKEQNTNRPLPHLPPRIVSNVDPYFRDYILVSNAPPPTTNPPPIPGYRRRSKTTSEPILPRLLNGTKFGEWEVPIEVDRNNKTKTGDISSDDDSDDYVEPNEHVDSLFRSNSDTMLNRRRSIKDEDERVYAPVFDAYVFDDLHEPNKNFYDEPCKDENEEALYYETEPNYETESKINEECDISDIRTKLEQKFTHDLSRSPLRKSKFYCAMPKEETSEKDQPKEPLQYIYNQAYDHRISVQEKKGANQMGYTDQVDTSPSVYSSPYETVETESTDKDEKIEGTGKIPRRSPRAIKPRKPRLNQPITERPSSNFLNESVSHSSKETAPLSSKELKCVSSNKGPKPVPRKKTDLKKVNDEAINSKERLRLVTSIPTITQAKLTIADETEYQNTL